MRTRVKDVFAESASGAIDVTAASAAIPPLAADSVALALISSARLARARGMTPFALTWRVPQASQLQRRENPAPREATPSSSPASPAARGSRRPAVPAGRPSRDSAAAVSGAQSLASCQWRRTTGGDPRAAAAVAAVAGTQAWVSPVSVSTKEIVPSS